MAENNSEPRVREKQLQLAVSNREKLIAGRIRFVLGMTLLTVVAFANIFIAPKFEVWHVNNTEFSTAELAEQAEWIKGAAPILAKNFDSVVVTNIRKDVELAFDFDSALAVIYRVETNTSATPLDLRSAVGDDSGAQGRALAELLESRGLLQHESDVLCQRQQYRWCRLQLIWRDEVALRPLPAVFVAVALEDKLFALIDSELFDELPQLGAAVAAAEARNRGDN
jgi:hypothetical protein